MFMKKLSHKVKGIIPALINPNDNNNDISKKILKQQVKRNMELDVSGY